MGVKLDFSCSGKSINSHRDQGGGHQSIGRVIWSKRTRWPGEEEDWQNDGRKTWKEKTTWKT